MITYTRNFDDGTTETVRGHRSGPLAVSRHPDTEGRWQIDHIQSGKRILPSSSFPFFYPRGLRWGHAQQIAKELNLSSEFDRDLTTPLSPTTKAILTREVTEAIAKIRD